MVDGHYAKAARSFERARELHPDSALYAVSLAAVYDQLGRVDDAVSLLEKGPPRWRSHPNIRFWLAMSFALGGHREQAAAEFAALRALAPMFTVAIERRLSPGHLESKLLDRIAALSLEYGTPEK